MMTTRTSLAAAACGLLIGVQADFGQAAAAQTAAVPEALEAPAGQVLAVTAHGTGVQIYQCIAGQDDPARYSWTLKEPRAVLRSRSGRILAKHYAGPTWEASDGSKVVGEVAAKSPAPQAGAVPWLLLHAKTTSGTGLFSGVASIQRLRTVGGQAPDAGCDQAHSGREVKVPYSAEYRFFKVPAP
jgi:hypothetical protein